MGGLTISFLHPLLTSLAGISSSTQHLNVGLPPRLSADLPNLPHKEGDSGSQGGGQRNGGLAGADNRCTNL